MPLPTSIKHITVTGKWFKGDGTAASGTVSFARSVYLQGPGDNAFVAPHTHSATLDADGAISISLPATDDPDWSPQGWMYTVTENLEGLTSRSYSLSVPHDTVGDTLDLADVVNIVPPTTAELYAPLGHTHDSSGISPTLFDAKGDLIIATAADTPARLGIGADGQVLTADSNVAAGAKWATPSGGGGGISPTLLDAKGDLIVASANDTPARLGIGANGTFLKADSAQATGVKWEALTSTDLALAVLKNPGGIQAISIDGTYVWLRITTVTSAEDTNEDVLQVRILNTNGTTMIRTFRLNGNGEPRAEPSEANRTAFRVYEIAEAVNALGSTGNVWEVSTNPTNPGAREAYWTVRGNAHPTQPGWLVGTRPFQATNGRFTGNLQVDGTLTVSAPSWTSLTLSTNVIGRDVEGQPTPASCIDSENLVSLRGTIEWSTTFASGTALATIANADHRPLGGRRTFSIRTGPPHNTSTEMNIETNGEISFIVSSGAAGRLGLDGIHFRRHL
jgi:hypothetical protein